MAWLPDTNIWIDILKRPGGNTEQRMLEHSPNEILFCSVVKAELWHGTHKHGRTDRRLAVLDRLFAGFTSLPFEEIRHGLEWIASAIGPNDLKIAAICRSANVTLVTSNRSEFERVLNLQVDDWSN